MILAASQGDFLTGTRLALRALPVVVAFLACRLSLAADGGTKISFDRDVRPILSDKCYRCHGPDSKSRQADMRLDTRKGIPEHVLVSGKPDESELVRRVLSDDPDELMPPADSHLKLTAEQKEL